jgi:hypothetical protein
MAELRDYEKHIADTHAGNKGKAWCGELLGEQFVFVDVDHTAMNARNNGRLVPCPKCLQAIKAAFDGQQ